MRRLLLAGLLLCLIACGPSEPSQPPATKTAPAAPSAAAPAETSPATPTANAPPTPFAQSAGDPARGAKQYEVLCASCHGARGAGDGPAGQALTPRPARHDDGSYMNALSNEHVFRVIKEGGAAVGKSPMMAAWGGALSDDQIRDVVAFIRTLAEPPYTGPKP